MQDGVEASAGSATASFTTTNDGTHNNLWEPEALSFTATSPMTTISLIGNSGTNYIGLDNVSVVQTAPVPEASPWWMMAGGGVASLVVMLRKKRCIA